MARWMGIDYGSKRTGIAVTDPERIISQPLTTIPTSELLEFLKRYLQEEKVELIVIGEPLHLDGNPTQIHQNVLQLKDQLEKGYSHIRIVLEEESFTSSLATDVIRKSGLKKKQRQEKDRVDRVAAAIILEQYLQKNSYPGNS